MNNLQAFMLDVSTPVFTGGGLVVGVIFFIVFLGISLTVFLATKNKMTFARRGLIFLFMLVVTIVGSIAFLVGGVYLDARDYELGRKEREKMRQEQMNRQVSSQSDEKQKNSNINSKNSNSGNINSVKSNR